MLEMLACLEFKRMDILGRVVRVVVEKWRVNGEGQSDVGDASGGADRGRQRYLIICMLLKSFFALWRYALRDATLARMRSITLVRQRSAEVA